MKKLLLLFLLSVSLHSCTDNKKQLIADYEQTIGETKTDLKLKVSSLEFIQKITALDSLNFIYEGESQKFLEDSIDLKIEEFNAIKIKSLKEIDSLKLEDNIFYYDLIRSNEDLIKSVDNYLNLCYKSKDYLTRKDDVLANKWKCTYTIINPLLNNAKQEITKYYIFNADNSKILETEKL